MIKKVLNDRKIKIFNKEDRERLEANFALFKRIAELPRKYKVSRREAAKLKALRGE